MLSRRALVSSTRLLTQATRQKNILLRPFSTTSTIMGKDSKMPTGPPKHQMVYFKELSSAQRSFGQFRKVLHTGLYSQLVAMEIPPGGDIGDEVHTVDQVLMFTSGEAKAIVAGKEQVSKSHTSQPRQANERSPRTSKPQMSLSSQPAPSINSSTPPRASHWSW